MRSAVILSMASTMATRRRWRRPGVVEGSPRTSAVSSAFSSRPLGVSFFVSGGGYGDGVGGVMAMGAAGAGAPRGPARRRSRLRRLLTVQLSRGVHGTGVLRQVVLSRRPHDAAGAEDVRAARPRADEPAAFIIRVSRLRSRPSRPGAALGGQRALRTPGHRRAGQVGLVILLPHAARQRLHGRRLVEGVVQPAVPVGRTFEASA
jgi:hypothetical protein